MSRHAIVKRAKIERLKRFRGFLGLYGEPPITRQMLEDAKTLSAYVALLSPTSVRNAMPPIAQPIDTKEPV